MRVNSLLLSMVLLSTSTTSQFFSWHLPSLSQAFIFLKSSFLFFNSLVTQFACKVKSEVSGHGQKSELKTFSDDTNCHTIVFLTLICTNHKGNKCSFFACLFYFVIIDCCLRIYDGDEEFKGRYSFPETFANNTYIVQCKYNSAELSRKCVSDMKNGPFWSETDLNNCDAKYTTTNDLLKLNEVSVR